MHHDSEYNIIDPVQDILRLVDDLKGSTAVSQPSFFTGSIPPSEIDSVDLPRPHPLLPSLLNAGFTHQLAVSISEAYQIRAEELRQRIQKSIVTACRELAQVPAATLATSPDTLIRRLVSTFTQIYLHRLEQWKKETIRRIKQAPQTPINVAAKSHRHFNQEYVPLLERFFEENPFPTHADKVFLAQKSNMQYRQIHVWFQNRRNRTKREGNTLQRKPICEEVTSVKSYECTKSRFQTPKSSSPAKYSMGGAAEIEGLQHDIPKEQFASPPPPHAFPSSYPPTCDYDPFPCKAGLVYFDKPKWRRVPCTKLPLSVSTDIDDLVERFSLLNVREETRSRGSPKPQSCAAIAAITVIPSRAPHPSLVFRQYTPSPKPAQPHPSVRAPASCSKVFQSPSSTSKPATLVPSDKSKSEPRKRKTAPLPRRFPGQIPITSRDTTPSESSSTSPSPRLSSTDSENRSCSISSVSSITSLNIPELSHSSESRCRPSLGSLHRLGSTVAFLPSPVS